MLCPVCKVALQITDRQGVEIDYCPQCRGVWLDRGELDKLIERAAQWEGRPANPPSQNVPAQNAPRPPAAPGYYRDDDDYEYKHNDPYYHQRKKKGFLGEIFDIFD